MSRSATSTHLLNISRDGDSATSLGSLFQCLTTLLVKKFFLITNLNLPWHNLRPFPCPEFLSYSYNIKKCAALSVVFNVFICHLIFVVVKSCNVLFLKRASMQNDKKQESPNQGGLSKTSMGLLQIDRSSFFFFS